MTQPDVDLKDRTIAELGAFPRESLADVLHFVEFLKTKLKSGQIDGALSITISYRTLVSIRLVRAVLLDWMTETYV